MENTFNYNGEMVDQDTAGQVTKSCYFEEEECVPSADTPDRNPCDILLYVVWSGTDSGGKALQSQAYRFSEFPVQELTDRLTQAIPTFGLGGRRLEDDNL